MQLSREAFERARRFVAANARPLEVARFSYHFGGAPAGDVLVELARFQNPDGGFGQALEPDCRIPGSSALATSVAFQILREVGAGDTTAMVAAAIEYLVRTCDRDVLSWRIVPELTESIPQAPWWNGLAGEKGTHFELNPTAELLGYLYDFPAGVPPDLLATLSDRVEAHLAGLMAITMHDFLCAKRLAETKGLAGDYRAAIVKELERLLDSAVARASSQWASHCLLPIRVASSPESFFYAHLREAVAENLDYEIATQREDGSWPLTWSWGDQYPDTWQRAAVECAGVVALRKLIALKRYGRIVGQPTGGS